MSTPKRKRGGFIRVLKKLASCHKSKSASIQGNNSRALHPDLLKEEEVTKMLSPFDEDFSSSQSVTTDATSKACSSPSSSPEYTRQVLPPQRFVRVPPEIFAEPLLHKASEAEETTTEDTLLPPPLPLVESTIHTARTMIPTETAKSDQMLGIEVKILAEDELNEEPRDEPQESSPDNEVEDLNGSSPSMMFAEDGCSRASTSSYSSNKTPSSSSYSPPTHDHSSSSSSASSAEPVDQAKVSKFTAILQKARHEESDSFTKNNNKHVEVTDAATMERLPEVTVTMPDIIKKPRQSAALVDGLVSIVVAVLAVWLVAKVQQWTPAAALASFSAGSP